MAIGSIAIRITSNAKEVKSEIKEIENELTRLRNSKPEITLRANQLNDVRAKIKDIDLEIAKLGAKKKDVNVLFTPGSKEALAQTREFNKQINILKAQKAHLQVDAKELQGAITDASKLENKITSLTKRKSKLEIQQQDIADSDTGLSKLGQQLSKLGSSRTKINISTNISQAGNAIDSLGSKMLKSLNPLGSRLNQIIGIGAAVKLVGKAFDMVSSSVGGAIGRFDTLNNFPKVMANLKISSEDSAVAVEMLKTGLDGLPTTLDSAVSSVQRFTSKNKDVKKSTRQFLALNNALLAGGAAMDIQESALEQLSQGYSKGRIDMMEWRSVLTAMPAQIDQVAQAYGMSSDALGEALRTGTISMDSFMDKIVELNENGANGFLSFADQAKNAIGGIRTQMANMKTAVVRGLTAILIEMNEVLKDTPFEGVGGVFGTIGKSFEKALNRIAKLIKDNKSEITEFITYAQGKFIAFHTMLKNFDWKSFGAGIKEGFAELKKSIQTFWKVVSPIVSIAKNRITALGGGSFAKGLGRLPALFIKVAVGAKVLGKSLKVLGKISDLALPSFGKKKGGGGGLEFNFDAGKMLNQVKNLALVFGAVKIIQELAQALKDIDEKVPSNLSKLAPKFANMAIAIGGMGVIVAIAGKLAEKNPTAAIAGLASIAVIGLELMLVAEAIKQIDDKVPSGIKNFAKKMSNMAIAIVGMGVIVAAVGALAATGAGAVIAIAGIAAIALISGSIMLLAEAIKQLNNKLPTDFTGIKSKINGMAEVIAFFTLINLGSSLGLFANALGALNLVAVTAGIVSMVVIGNKLSELQDIKLNGRKIKNQLSKLKNALNLVANKNGIASTIANFIKNSISAKDLKNVKKIVDLYFKIGMSLTSIQKLESKIDMQKIRPTLKRIEGAINELGGEGGIVGALASLAEHAINTVDLSIITGISKKYVDIGNELIKIQDLESKIDMQKIRPTLDRIENAINILGGEGGIARAFMNLVHSAINNFDLGIITSVIDKYHDIGSKLSEVQDLGENIDLEALESTIDKIKQSFVLLGGEGDLAQAFATMVKHIIENIDLNTLQSIVDNYLSIGNSLEKFDGLGDKINITEIEKVMKAVRDVIEIINENAGILINTTSEIELNNTLEVVDGIKKLADKLMELHLRTINKDRIKTLIEDMAEVIAAMDNFPSVKGIDSIESLVESFKGLIETLNGLADSFVPVGKGYGEQVIQGFMDSDVVTSISTNITDLLTELNGKKKKFETLGKSYGNALKKGFGTAIDKLSDVIDSQITKLRNNSSKFTAIGTLFGNSMALAFARASEGLSSSISRQVRDIQDSLNSISMPTFNTNIGTSGGAVHASTGGFISSSRNVLYRSNGGLASVFKPRGTDTIPAMLSPGEYVLNSRAVKAMGVSNLNRLNSLDIKGMFYSMARRFGIQQMSKSPITTYNVTNINNNNNNAKVTQNMRGSQGFSYVRANRWARSL